MDKKETSLITSLHEALERVKQQGVQLDEDAEVTLENTEEYLYSIGFTKDGLTGTNWMPPRNW